MAAKAFIFSNNEKNKSINLWLELAANCLCLFLVLCVFGCIQKKEFTIEIPAQTSATIVEAYLTPDKPMEISITKNNLLTDELIFQSIWNAKVFISDKVDTMSLLNIYYFNNTRNLLINYRNDSTPLCFKNKAYYLRIITKSGDTLLSQTEAVSPIKLEGMKVEQNYLRLMKKVEAGSFTGYVRVDMTSFKHDSIFSSTSKYIDCNGFRSDSLKILLPEDIRSGDSLLVRVFHIRPEYYNYQTSILNAQMAYYDPFLSPEKIKSNIKNGIGIFTFYTSDSKKIKL